MTKTTRIARLTAAALLVAVGLVVPTDPASPQAQPGSPPPTYQPYTVLDIERPGDGPVIIADPSVVKVGDTWYLYATTSNDGFEVWSSDDLATWTYGGLVWAPTPGSWNDEGNFWAPELRVDGADVWMYYTANERLGVAKATSPLGPFVDQLSHPMVGAGYGGVGDGNYTDGGGLLENNDEKSIDAFVLETSDGKLWLYAAIFTPIHALAVWPMSDPTTPVGDPTVVLGHLDETWEGFVREAPFVIERQGTFHLMYSGQGGDSPCYSVGVATASSPTGPFTRRADNPILKQSPADAFWGPGHNGVVEGANNDLLMFFHTKVDDEMGYERRLRYAVLDFNGAGEIVIDPPPPGADAPVEDSCIFRFGTPGTPTTAPAEPQAVPVAARPAFTG